MKTAEKQQKQDMTFYALILIIALGLMSTLTSCSKSENENPQPQPQSLVNNNTKTCLSLADTVYNGTHIYIPAWILSLHVKDNTEDGVFYSGPNNGVMVCSMADNECNEYWLNSLGLNGTFTYKYDPYPVVNYSGTENVNYMRIMYKDVTPMFSGTMVVKVYFNCN